MFIIEGGSNRRAEYHLCRHCCRMINCNNEAFVKHTVEGKIIYNHQVCPPLKQKYEPLKV